MRAVTLSGFLLMLLLLGAGREASGISLRPAVDGSVRDGLDFPKDGIADTVLDGAVVQVLNVDRLVAPFEDRGIIEFDITGGLPAQGRLKLVLPVFAAMGPFPFTVGVFGYAGDGVLSLADFAAGSFLHVVRVLGAAERRPPSTSLSSCEIWLSQAMASQVSTSSSRYQRTSR